MNMPIWARLLACAGFAAMSPTVTAGPASDALTTCVADNTTGKDRKELAQWMFIAMAAHPEIKPLSNVTDDVRNGLNQRMAAMATRLITENCRVESMLAMETEGGASFEAAFGSLGKLAMQEFMSNPAVNASFVEYTKYLDKQKFEAAFPRR